MSRRLKLAIIAVIIIVVLLAVFFGLFNIDDTVSFEPNTVTVHLPADNTRLELARVLGQKFDWDHRAEQNFASVYAQIHWAAFGPIVGDIFNEVHQISAEETERLLINSAKYFEPKYDFLATVYVSGSYEIPGGSSPAEISNQLVTRVKLVAGENLKTYIAAGLEPKAEALVLDFIRGRQVLLPDLVPLPPKDLTLQETKNSILLSFSTVYYNRGEGPLELRADPTTIEVSGDVEREVFQRIYRADDTYDQRPAGTFLWHAPHLHYHFADFVIYDLEAVDAPEAPDLSGVQEKSTFCIRDVSRVALALENTPLDATYRVCGRERQGISVGWGDTYFYTYPDQNLNITGLPTGVYKLSFSVNPENRFEEVTKANNVSSATFHLDMENLTLKILAELPPDSPTVEHVYEKQDF